MRILICALMAVGGASAASLPPFSTAENCGRCHRAIYKAWKSSAHARAMENLVFQDALRAAEERFGSQATRVCIGCHAPLAIPGSDMGFQKKATWEGVTCDYCHAVREVSFSGQNPKSRFEFGLVKSGPLKDAASSAHGTVYSEVHTSSAICAPCHEYKNPLGFAVLTTYSEWKNSRYGKEGKNCQSCHMPVAAGPVADPRVAKTSTAQINLHAMPGSHSLDQLTRTIKAQLSAKRDGGSLLVDVRVGNAGAGHFVPTGSPMRKIILEVSAQPYGGPTMSERRTYERTVADSKGAAIGVEYAAFVQAAKALSDTRLAPDEWRLESFRFPVPEQTRVQLKATFQYYYSPLGEAESQKQVTFLTIQRFVR